MSNEKTVKVEVELTEKEVSGLRRVKRANTLTSIGDVVHDALPPEGPVLELPVMPGAYWLDYGDGWCAYLYHGRGDWSCVSRGARFSVSMGDVRRIEKARRPLDLSSQPPDDVDVLCGFVFGWEAPGALGGKSCVMVYLDADADGITDPVAVQLLLPRAKS